MRLRLTPLSVYPPGSAGILFLHCAPELPDQEIGCSAVQRRPKHRRQRRHGGGHIRKQRQKIHTPTELPFNGSGGKNERGSTVAVSGSPWSLFSVQGIGKPLETRTYAKNRTPGSIRNVSKLVSGLVRETGLEPASAYCTHEPESCASANSAIPARCGQGWIRTTEVRDGRFTVCSLWPLGNLPI